MRSLNQLRAIATALVVSVADLWHCDAQAQGALKTVYVTVNMVCHESGGSGLPLTDYVNNVDWGGTGRNGGPLDLTPLQNSAPIQTEASSSPTSCAQATTELESLGFQLTQVSATFLAIMWRSFCCPCSNVAANPESLVTDHGRWPPSMNLQVLQRQSHCTRSEITVSPSHRRVASVGGMYGESLCRTERRYDPYVNRNTTRRSQRKLERSEP
jgi:hypothetical protein